MELKLAESKMGGMVPKAEVEEQLKKAEEEHEKEVEQLEQ